MSNKVPFSRPRKIKSVRLFYGLLGLAFAGVAISLFTYSTYEEKEDGNHQKYFNRSYKIFSLNLPNQLSFVGENVPLEEFDVREKLDRELLVNTYWQSQTLLFIKRANRWFPVIEPLLKENGVPDDFKYLALIESGFTSVVSPAGASGFWQIMKTTGRERGLEINKVVDERYNLEKATKVACKYLKDAKEKFGSWTLATASYNMGMAGLEKQLNRQRVDNYYDLLLNEETARYVFRIMAVKRILENPQQYGFHYRSKDLYPNIRTNVLEVDTGISNLAIFAKSHGINYKQLKLFNPWLRQNYLTNTTRKKYRIQIPDKAYIESVNKRILSDEPEDSLSAR